MTATDPQPEETVQEDRSWLHADVDGRPVSFWIGVAVAIAVATLGLGGWWVWGLDRGMPTADGEARLLRPPEEVIAAADAGDVVLEPTDVVVDMPFPTWPGGER